MDVIQLEDAAFSQHSDGKRDLMQENAYRVYDLHSGYIQSSVTMRNFFSSLSENMLPDV